MSSLTSPPSSNRPAAQSALILRATAILGSSSVVTVLVGLASSKAWALLVGPAGFGTYGILQNMLNLFVLIAGIGIGPGLVRMGAAALARGEQAEVAALKKASWILYWLPGGLCALLLIALKAPVSRTVLGGVVTPESVILLAIALLFSLAAGIETSYVNAHHRVGTLARIAVLNTVLGALLSLGLVWWRRAEAIVPAVCVAAGVNYAVAAMLRRQAVGSVSERPDRSAVRRAITHLVRFGVPYSASMLVGMGVQLCLPLLVLHGMGATNVGFFRGATTISDKYLGFLLLALGQDYFPRVSAVQDQPEALRHLVNQQHRLLLLITVPMILIFQAMAPYLVPLVYSHQFDPMVGLLQWQLAGSLLKFSSWTLGFVVLARCPGQTYFLTELIGGMAALTSSWLGMRWFGLVGLGMGFVATYVLYYLGVAWVVRREIQLIWSRDNVILLLGGCLATGLVLMLPLDHAAVRTPCATFIALVASLWCARILWLEFNGGRHALA